MTLLSKLLYTRPRIEEALSALDKNRLKLPVINPRVLFPDFDIAPVTLHELPSGPWSSPITDVVVLAKIALCLRPKRVLEIGSYRGYTAKLLAEHTPLETRIVAFDADPRHGAAYRNTQVESKIDRRVGRVSLAEFVDEPRGHYDLIFLDADHSYEAVEHDTDVLLPLLSPTGAIVWHDYANWGKFSRKNGVPEALHQLSKELPIASISGSWLAIHMPAWCKDPGASQFAESLQAARHLLPGQDAWTTEILR